MPAGPPPTIQQRGCTRSTTTVTSFTLNLLRQILPDSYRFTTCPRSACQLHRNHSGHDDFLLEAAGGDGQEKGAHGEENQSVDPEMREAGAAQDDAPGDVDVIARGYE